MIMNARGRAAAVVCVGAFLLSPGVGAQTLDCAALANSALAEPVGYAEQCGLPANVSQPTAPSLRAPTDIAFVHNIRTAQPTTGFGRHALNNMAGTTVISPTARTVFAMDFNPTATTLYTVNGAVAATPVLETTDTTTGAVTAGPTITGLGGLGPTDLVIDPTSGAAFVSTTDGTNSTLFSLNLTTGAATQIGSMGAGLVIDLAINCSGAMYAHDISTDTLHSVNPATGARTLIGPHGLAANFAQGMDFDNNDGQLYAWVYTGGGTYTFGTFNLTTGAITPVNTNTPAGEWEGAIQNTCTPPAADLSITKTATAPTPIAIGSQITYNLGVANAGPSAAAAVVVTDPLPANTSPVSNTCGATLAGNTLTWNVGSLANGASATCSVVVSVTGTGAINNTATVAATTTDPVTTNNSAAANLAGVAAEANLSITKTATAPNPINIGSQITYNLAVSNAGPGPASAVVVTDPLPANTTHVSNTCAATVAANTLTWNVGSLANAASATCAIVVNVTGVGPISNTASVASSTTDPVPTNNSATAVLGGIATSVPATSTLGLWLLALLTLGIAVVALQRRG